MSIPTIPMVNAPNYYVNGMLLGWIDATHIGVTFGEARNSNDINDIIIPIATPIVTIDTAIQGPGGLDIGVIAVSSFYAVYVIGDSTGYQPSSAVLSLSAAGPTLPYGYDMYRRVGFVLTDGATLILPFWQEFSINSTDRKMWYDAPIAVLGAAASAAFVAQSLVTAVPFVCGQTNVVLEVDLLPTAAADFIAIRPTGSASVAGNVKASGDVAAVHSFLQIQAVTGLTVALEQSIDWMTDVASTAAISVAAYVDHL